MAFKPPHPPYDPTDKGGFSYDTVVRRWPVIITSVIDELHNKCHFLVLESQKAEDLRKLELGERINEGNEIVAKISKLKYEMARDRELEPIIDDGEPLVEIYNRELENLASDKKNTWFAAPWLYAECYLYRLLRSYCALTKHWKSYDPFHSSKVKTFEKSGVSIFKIATTMHELEAEKDGLKSDPAAIEVLFREMVQMCLWGNATDLSLLTHLTQEDIHHLQTVGKDAQAARQKFILKDDQEGVWGHLKNLSNAQVDFVLDNAGFELFTDLVFADFLVTYTPHVSRVVFHPKLIPWFVSDVLPIDFAQTIEYLLDPAFFSDLPSNNKLKLDDSHLRAMTLRWKSYIEQGIFSLSAPLDTPLGGNERSTLADFWTTPYPYWDLESLAPKLFKELEKSGLVIFKGDLNYRKLTGDIQWPSWTPFSEALGPLAGSFPLLSLRTNKADVVVGVPKDVVEKLDASGEKWRVNGSYALISFHAADA